MEVLKDCMKVLASNDAAEVYRAPERMGGHANEALAALFPKVSNGCPSDVTVETWIDWEGFFNLAVRLQAYTCGQAAAEESGLMMSEAHGTGMMTNGTMMGSSLMDSGSMMGGNVTAVELIDCKCPHRKKLNGN